MFQPAGQSTPAQPVIKAGDTTIKTVGKFCYLGSILSSDALVDNDISTRLSKASYALSRLSKRLWNDQGIRLDTKLAAISQPSWLPYSTGPSRGSCIADTSQSWNNSTCVAYGELPMSSGRTTYKILKSWISARYLAFLISAQLHWTGHVICMSVNRLPKQAFYSQLEHGTRSRGGQ